MRTRLISLVAALACCSIGLACGNGDSSGDDDDDDDSTSTGGHTSTGGGGPGGSGSGECPSAPVLTGPIMRICTPGGLADPRAAGGRIGRVWMAGNGQVVAFIAYDVPHLVPDDINGEVDVFLHEIHTGVTTLVDRAPDGSLANGGASEVLGLSYDGSKVAFESHATNLQVGTDDNAEHGDAFVRDVWASTTIRYSYTQFHPDSMQWDGDTIWPDRFAFAQDNNRAAVHAVTAPSDGGHVFIHTLLGGATEIASRRNSDGGEPAGYSRSPSIDANGRRIAFASTATSLLPYSDSNGSTKDVFVFDRVAGQMIPVSTNEAGLQASEPCEAPMMNWLGTHVVFHSADALFASDDTNGVEDVFVKNFGAGSTTPAVRVSVSSTGEQGDGPSRDGALSADARFVVFSSQATNLVAGDTNGVEDVFVHDAQTGTTERLSVSAEGAEANGECRAPTISHDGRYVAFSSRATSLVPGDTSDDWEAFVVVNPLL